MSGATLIRAGRAESCRPWPRHALDPDAWAALAAMLVADPTLDLLGLWADTQRVHALFRDGAAGEVLFASTLAEDGAYAALSPARPAAAWFERMIRDLWGHAATGGTDARPWLDHGSWPHLAPLAARPAPAPGAAELPAFLGAEEEETVFVPIGPVHGAVEEAAHWRLTVDGEAVRRLELRLGYLHKGTLGLMRGKSPRVAARFAARLAGDATVAHSVAFARAAEAAAGTDAPPRAASLRAVMAEVERIAGHLADLAAVAEAVAEEPLAGRCLPAREALLRASAVAFGHRLMMDCVVPGGVIADIAAGGAAALGAALAEIDRALPAITRRVDVGPFAARIAGLGPIAPELVRSLALPGPAGRAAGALGDVRRSPGDPPYDALPPGALPAAGADVAARLRQRLGEIGDSARLLGALLAGLPDGPISLPLPMVSGEGLGWAEGARGAIWHWLRLDGGQIAACFPRDPAWLTWPAVEAAAEGADLADVMLIARSFATSVSGVDL